jgi:hypothetical protein
MKKEILLLLIFIQFIFNQPQYTAAIQCNILSKKAFSTSSSNTLSHTTLDTKIDQNGNIYYAVKNNFIKGIIANNMTFLGQNIVVGNYPNQNVGFLASVTSNYEVRFLKTFGLIYTNDTNLFLEVFSFSLSTTSCFLVGNFKIF